MSPPPDCPGELGPAAPRMMQKGDPPVAGPLSSHAAAAESGRRPEAGERKPVRRFTKLLEGALANLPDALARHAHQRADLLQRHRLGTLLQPVVEVEDLALARREVLPEDAVDELAHELCVGAVLDLAAVDSGEALAERR